MSIRTELQDAVQAELEPEMELGILNWRGLNFPCMPVGFIDQYGDVMGPLLDESRQNFRLRKNALETWTGDTTITPPPSGSSDLPPPTPGHQIWYHQAWWRIEKVRPDPVGAFWLIETVSSHI